MLDESGQFYRDSCITYASEILKMYADNRATVIADSSHYQEAYLRMKEANDYAQFRYRELEKYVFSEGQTPFLDIMANPKYYWNKTVADLQGQYDFSEFGNDSQPADSVSVDENNPEENNPLSTLSSKGENAFLVIGCAIQLVVLAVFWLVSLLVLWLIQRFSKKKRFIHPKRLPLLAALGGTVLYVVVFSFLWTGDEYFQLAVLLTIVCISDLLDRYKERWLDKRVAAMRERITYVGGTDRESLLFGATWFYDLIKQVALPAMVFLSLPMCIHLSLNVFDFNDLFVRLYCDPFVQFLDKNGHEALTISARSIVNLLILFYILRYVNRAIHTIWRYVRYMAFMHRHKRDSIRANEINLSLANSLISVLIWFAYVIVVVATWKMPVGSLTLVAGGLSAGIGIALKDIINNFIYGIQLMGGRLRVGDWIECDGVRGKVASINYQCVQMETLDGTEMSFLNATLFGKNFTNLTRNNSYEFTKIIAGVAYGTDIKKVREVLTEAMQQVRTKDQYGREIVEPKYGIKVVVGDMADSSVNIIVKQYVLVPERIAYVDRSKEVIYEALNAAGIAIPFPQCDVHLIKDDTL